MVSGRILVRASARVLLWSLALTLPVLLGTPSVHASPWPVIRHTVAHPRALVIGDSITCGGWRHVAGIDVDCQVGRGVAAGLDALARTPAKPRIIILELGTNNYGAGAQQVGRWVRRAERLASGHEVYWVNVHLPGSRRAAAARFNQHLDQATAGSGVMVADWDYYAGHNHVAMAPDLVHYTPTGYRAWGRYINLLLS